MKTFEQLEVGKFYIPVFERLEPLDVFGNINDTHRTDSPFYQYLGGKEFVSEGGETVDGFYDPELGIYVAVDAPDGFLQ